ncbi:MAG: Phosphocarrier protein kinase/phosphorylase, nitrogen regulation associated [Myxococcales bacterium]|nr:Phosphocarrier protein kinase/phosphorylase, nitrogen regulation associated [Myxococcales bacterium]
MTLARRRGRSATIPKVHTRGEARLDAMLELAEEASRPAPLADVLQSLCTRIAQVLAVDVCSIYLRELVDAPSNRRVAGDLVLRATSGYSPQAVGRVRMRVGEGLTGFAVECLRPVSVARASTDARNKSFDDMDEKRFPSLCAVPLVDGGRAVGALVVQRRLPRAFGSREIVLVASTAPPVLFALERARLRERDRLAEEAAAAPPAPHGRVHEVTLRGQPAAPGHALGTIAVRRHHQPHGAAPRVGSKDDERARLGAALVEAADEMTKLVALAMSWGPLDRATMQSLVSPARFVLDDARLRGRMRDHVDEGASAEAAVERVMREYTRVLSSSGDRLLADRALEVEALCLRVLNRLGAPATRLPPGSVLAAARLTVCDAIELRAGHAGGAVLSAPTTASPGLGVAVALCLPVVAGVGELFRWVSDGDRVLVDGDAGVLTVNPSRVDVAAHRKRE